MALKKPKVLWLPKWYPNRLDLFDGNFIESHAMAVQPYADIAVLFVHSDSALTQMYEVSVAHENGFPVVRVYFKKSARRIPILTSLVLLFRYIKAQQIGYQSILKEFGKPDLTHIHVLTRSSYLARWLKKKQGIPYLISEHWSGYFPDNGAYKGFLKKTATQLIVKGAARVTAVSRYLMRSMQSHNLKNRYEIIANVVDTDIFSPQKKQKNTPTKKKLVHVSTLSTIPKNFPKILQVIHALSQKRNDFELHVVGDGEEGEQQRKRAKDLGIFDGPVYFYGNVSKKEVATQMMGADAVILFSLFENQPCVMVESFAAGVPFIGPDVGGISEHLTPENGILISKDNTEELSNAIEKILDGGIGHNPEAMHTYAHTHFSNQQVGQQFADLYREILAEKTT